MVFMKHWALFVCVVIVLGCVVVEGRLKSKRASVLHHVGVGGPGFREQSICLFIGAPTNEADKAHLVNLAVIQEYATEVLLQFSIDQCIEGQGEPPQVKKPDDLQGSYDYMAPCMEAFAANVAEAGCSDVVFSMHGMTGCDAYPNLLYFQQPEGALKAYLPFERALDIVSHQNQQARVHFASCVCPPAISHHENVGLCENYVLLPGRRSHIPGWMLIPVPSPENKAHYCKVVQPQVVDAVYNADNYEIPDDAVRELVDIVPPDNGPAYEFLMFNEDNQVTKQEVKV